MAIFGSAFWGPGDAQQAAEGYFPAQGEWNNEQYRAMLERMSRAGYNADELQQWSAEYFQNLATHGTGTPDDVRNYGNWIMPEAGRRGLIDARTGRLAGVGADLGETLGGAQQRYGELGRGIGQNYDVLQGDINDAFGRAGARNEAVGGDILSSINQTYGGARGNVADVMTGLRRGAEETFGGEREAAAGLYGDLSGRSTGRYGDLSGRSVGRYGDLSGRSAQRFGDLQAGAADVYGGLRDLSGQQIGGLQGRSTGRFGDLQGRSGQGYGELGQRAGDIYAGLGADADRTIAGLRAGNTGAYDEATQALDVLSPTGQARAATAARAFAPQVASTRGRLRAAGIDANSPEAASVIGRVEAQRSRAMDDAYTDSAREFLDRKTALTLGGEDVNRQLGLTGLQTRLGLGQSGEEIGRGLGLGALQNYQQLGLGEMENYQGLSMADLANQLGLSQDELKNYQQLGLGELENYQGLGERELQNYQGLGERELQNYQGLQTEGGAIGRGLGIQRLLNDQGLTERQLGQETDLNLRAGDEWRNEMRRNLGMSTDLEMDRLAQTTGNRDRAFDRAWNWTEGQNALDREGWNARAGLAREQNAEDQWAYNFNELQPWMMGNDWLSQQERVKSGAAGPVMNQGNAYANQSIAQGQLARGFNADTANDFNRTIAIESPNAGWGSKLIAGAASTALTGGFGGMGVGLGTESGVGKFASGLGGVLGGAGGSYGGAGAGYGQGGTGGYYGQTYGQQQPWQPQPPQQQYGWGANPSNPMIFSAQAPQAPSAYWGDPGQYNIDYSMQPNQNYRLPRQPQRR